MVTNATKVEHPEKVIKQEAPKVIKPIEESVPEPNISEVQSPLVPTLEKRNKKNKKYKSYTDFYKKNDEQKG